jgi:hypothetical protein
MLCNRITGVYGLCPSSGTLNNQKTACRKLDLFPSSSETPTLLKFVLCNRPNRKSVSHHPEPETSSFRNVVCSRYLEVRMTDKVKKLGDSDYYFNTIFIVLITDTMKLVPQIGSNEK